MYTVWGRVEERFTRGTEYNLELYSRGKTLLAKTVICRRGKVVDDKSRMITISYLLQPGKSIQRSVTRLVSEKTDVRTQL